ncbi:MAG: precorrin-3B C(17)-methyltransferase [Desulfovibrio sp.]|nr:precorrin-3B C(17)-methyltransferase [Desulfovibrio sp.]
MNAKAGSLCVVGLGPGAPELMTVEAREILRLSDRVAGYDLYISLLPPDLLKDKIIISSGMRGERQRCREAIAAALEGARTAIVCSGDAGVYAMASLTLEILETENLLDEISPRIIPGVPALCAGAALLGAPLGHDFACVSLSDLLTPWEIIEKRLFALFAADFVCVLYNPRSRGRPDYLRKALDIAKEYRDASCPVGMARNIARAGQSTLIATLETFDPEAADMLSLVIVGNSETRVRDGYMITPRGYAKKYE